MSEDSANDGSAGSELQRKAKGDAQEQKREGGVDGAQPSKRSSRHSGEIDFSVPTLKHFATFTRTTQTLEQCVQSALRESRRLDHVLLTGRPGSGTTVLARALIRDFAPHRVVEIDAQIGVTAARMRRVMAKLQRRGVLFIRHIELLEPEVSHLVAAFMGGKKIAASVDDDEPGSMRPPWESKIDREIANSARNLAPRAEPELLEPDATVVGTALVPARLSYLLRGAFEQTFNLRNDPKALRSCISRVLAPHGIRITTECNMRIERVLGNVPDVADPIARSILARAQLDNVAVIRDELMKSILEEDLPNRLHDHQYAAALNEHLGGRKIKVVSSEEVERIAAETCWGPIAAKAAVAALVRERAKRKPERTVLQQP